MTREEILIELKRLQPWFHRIDLGGGLYTKTRSVMGEPIDHPSGPWQTIQQLLPHDLKGKTLIDVGCNGGFYSFEAKRRGAARVLGVDGQRQHVRQGLFVRKVLGLDVEFRRLNVYELTPRTVGQFDITLALGLLYHLKHPILALENLYQITKELLIIETAILPPKRTPESFLQPLGEQQMLLHSIAFVENPSHAKEQIANWFLPGVEALKSLLQSTGFEILEFVEAQDARAIVVCRKTKPSAGVEDNLQNFVAQIRLTEGPTIAAPSSRLIFHLTVQNVGSVGWPASGEAVTDKGAVYLGSHLLLESEDEVEWDYGRARLPLGLEPGESANIEIELMAPATPGRYIVEFDMVVEHVAWFEDHGSGTLRLPLTVE